jgi:hypothetical protein
MNEYFTSGTGEARPSSPAANTTTSGKKPIETSHVEPVDSARDALAATMNAYKANKTTVTVRRYALK